MNIVDKATMALIFGIYRQNSRNIMCAVGSERLITFKAKTFYNKAFFSN